MIQLGARKFADWNPAFFGRKSVWDWHLILDRGKSHSQNIAIASEIIKSYAAEDTMLPRLLSLLPSLSFAVATTRLIDRPLPTTS